MFKPRLFPRLFLSYAREDSTLADLVYQQLSDAGFEVYYDVKKTLVGEHFHTVIKRELARCDGVVAIISRDSATSPWCQAELYYAHALEKSIAPLRFGDPAGAVLAEPLAMLGQTIQYIPVPTADDYPRASAALLAQLGVARQRRRTRLLLRGLVAAGVALALGLAWRGAIARLNEITRERDRAAVLERVHTSTTNLTREAVNTMAAASLDDSSLVASLLIKARDREVSDLERINATLVSNALMLPRKPEQRWGLRGLNWQHSDLRRADFSDLTFMTGQMNDLSFSDVSFAGVSWNNAPTGGKEGLMLSQVKFDTCRFYSGWFRGTGGITVDFRNCRFRGTWVDVRGFGATRFRAELRDPRSPVITDEIALFENAVISRCVPAPEPHVMEIVPEGSEVEFDGVIFDSSRFRGRIRAEWFKKCAFQRCILPKALSRELLEKYGNTVEDCLWVDEPCDWI